MERRPYMDEDRIRASNFTHSIPLNCKTIWHYRCGGCGSERRYGPQVTEPSLELSVSEFTGWASPQPPDSLWSIERKLKGRLPCLRRLVLHKSIP